MHFIYASLLPACEILEARDHRIAFEYGQHRNWHTGISKYFNRFFPKTKYDTKKIFNFEPPNTYQFEK